MADLTTFKICAEKFNSLFPSFTNKIDFLKEFNNDKNCLKENANYKPIVECIEIMTNNAREAESRRNQQQVLMPILANAQKFQTREELVKYFEDDSFAFSLFCLTYATFFVEENKNERVDEIHKNITKLLSDVVTLLISE